MLNKQSTKRVEMNVFQKWSKMLETNRQKMKRFEQKSPNNCQKKSPKSVVWTLPACKEKSFTKSQNLFYFWPTVIDSSSAWHNAQTMDGTGSSQRGHSSHAHRLGLTIKMASDFEWFAVPLYPGCNRRKSTALSGPGLGWSKIITSLH